MRGGWFGGMESGNPRNGNMRNYGQKRKERKSKCEQESKYQDIVMNKLV